MKQIDYQKILVDLKRFDALISHRQMASIAGAALRFVEQQLQQPYASLELAVAWELRSYRLWISDRTGRATHGEHADQDAGWGVTQNEMVPTHHQFYRAYPGDGGGASMMFSPTPNWPSHTDQFGVYYVRGPLVVHSKQRCGLQIAK